jgi:hypothetical protein
MRMMTHPPDGPPRRQLRHFGWLLALMIALATSRLDAGPASLAAQALAAVLFAVGTVWPGALRGPYRLLAAVTAPIGWVVSRLLLVGVYYGLLTPLALVLRLLGRDVLRCHLDPAAATYWQPRPAAPERRRYLRQF